MAQTLTKKEIAQFQAIKLLVEAGATGETMRAALGLEERTWYRRWKKYKDIFGDPRSRAGQSRSA